MGSIETNLGSESYIVTIATIDSPVVQEFVPIPITTSSTSEKASSTPEQALENEMGTSSTTPISSTTSEFGELSKTSTSLMSKSSTLGTMPTTTASSMAKASTTRPSTVTEESSTRAVEVFEKPASTTSTTSTGFGAYEQNEVPLVSGATDVFGSRAIYLAAIFII